MEFKSFVSIDWDIVFQLVNTFIMYLILKKLLFKPVTEFMAQRTADVSKSYEEAEEAVKKGEEFKAEYEAKINSAKEEAQEIVRKASKRAEERAEEIIKAAQEEVTRLKERAHKDIEREKQKVMNEIKDDISSLAVLAASKIIESDIDEAKHEKLIGDFIKEVGEAKWQN
ncbi:F0F1 ATP synthase subunit B [Tepidibacter formicigenes]|jgi:F-type H+-transporting ATPase subunit b|uniref:ATP synthase subunit b n=1 Tax=Tepidibacter formicigenes DSM 15518 TaxID=1123349 RepID=A0A1M6MQU0_9FIRM|nr:F0F1 ATP synthase subunit B [Tepidibacter formicigenes]SHJ85878.1 F-type H+-transporting ATPase subunit b [Tepidibacter formicigenes DSM 15518]